MRKEQAVRDFKENILPELRKMYGNNDKVAIRTAWNDYTDMLCKDGIITQRQYNTWGNPF